MAISQSPLQNIFSVGLNYLSIAFPNPIKHCYKVIFRHVARLPVRPGQAKTRKGPEDRSSASSSLTNRQRRDQRLRTRS